jgi:hypothetical protein
MLIDGITNYTVAYTRKREVNGTVVSSSASLTQRWPVTRSRAERAVVAHLIEHGTVGAKAWQWARVTPVVEGQYTTWATPV